MKKRATKIKASKKPVKYLWHVKRDLQTGRFIEAYTEEEVRHLAKQDHGWDDCTVKRMKAV